MSNARKRDGTGWYRITAQSGEPAQIDIYDVIGMWGITAQDFIRDLKATGSGPVELHLNSPGGEVYEAYAIYNALKDRAGLSIVVDSLAASSASLILMASKDRRAHPLAQVMLHEAWAGIDGNAAALAKLAARLEQTSDQMAGVYASAAGGTKDDWRAVMQEERWYTAEEAMEAGLLTALVADGRVPEELQPAAWVPEDGKLAAIVRTYEDRAQRAATIATLVRNGITPESAAAAVADVSAAADTDSSTWDAAKAWANGAAAADPAAFYAGICAGQKAGDKSTQAAWALPYRYTPDGAPNVDGVKNALSRLPQTQGLTNEAAAKALLERLMKQIDPSYEPSSGAAGQASAAGAPAPTGGTQDMAEDAGALTIEARRKRIEDISARMTELQAEHPASALPSNLQAEWARIVRERDDHIEALASVEARNADIAAGLAASGGNGPRDRQLDDAGRDRPAAGQRRSTSFIPQTDIYDLGALRQRSYSNEDLPGLLRDNALRAIEQHRFPGAPDRERAQANVARLLDTISDDGSGVLATRILATGSPDYVRAFGRALAKGNPGALGTKDAQVLALGESDSGSYAVPFQLDPTINLTSNGTINPLRQISRVEQIVGKEYDLVNSIGVTVTRKAEFAPETDNSPVLTQPTVKAEEVSAFIPFSFSIEGDWTGLQAQMAMLIADGKDVEEAHAYTLGTGVAPDAGGVVTTMDSASNFNGTGGSGALGIDDAESLAAQVPPRFNGQASYMANRVTYTAYRKLFGAQAGFASDPWNRPSEGLPPTLWGYDAYEASDMVSTHATGDKPLICGDFKRGYLIVDRVGMNMELVPQLFSQAVAGAGVAMPTRQRGYLVWWRNNSVVLIPNAFRVLVVQ